MATNKVNIFINKDGTVKGLHCAILDKVRNNIGNSKVERASTIEFDHTRQEWEAHIFFNNKKFYAKDREEVLSLEREEIDSLIKQGCI